MNKKVGFVLLAAFVLSGCEGAMEKQRQIEAQRLAAQVELAQIQAASNERIAANEAQEQRLLDEYRTDRFIKLLRFFVTLVVPAALWVAVLVYRAYLTKLRLAAVLELGYQMSGPQRAVAVAGLLSASGVNSKTLLLEHQRR